MKVLQKIFLFFFLFSANLIAQDTIGKVIYNTNNALPSSCNFKEYIFPEPDDEGICSGNINESSVLNKIYFSQTHRLSIDHPFFFLIGHRPALFQLAVTGLGNSPDVFVEGLINGISIGTKYLQGPSILKEIINTDIPNFENYVFYKSR